MAGEIRDRMFHMTNDSGLFRTRAELEEREGAWPVGGNRFGSPSGDWVPLYEGKMVQAFDHRAANIVVNLKNQHRPAQPVPATPEQHQNPNWSTRPAVLGFRFGMQLDRRGGVGSRLQRDYSTHKRQNTDRGAVSDNRDSAIKCRSSSRKRLIAPNELLAANLNATILDFVTRQKVQGQTLNLFIVEQLPVVPLARYEFRPLWPEDGR